MLHHLSVKHIVKSTCSMVPESLYCRSKTGGMENKGEIWSSMMMVMRMMTDDDDDDGDGDDEQHDDGEIWSSMMPPPGPAVPLPLSSLFTALTHPTSSSSFETQLTHYCSQLVRVTNTHRNLFTAMTSSFTEIQCMEWTDSIKGQSVMIDAFKILAFLKLA